MAVHRILVRPLGIENFLSIIKELGVAQVTEACSNPKIRELSGKGGNEWQFRVNIDDVIMANTFAKSIAQQVTSAVIPASGVPASGVPASGSGGGAGTSWGATSASVVPMVMPSW